MKEQVYEFIVNHGIRLLQKYFPEYYAKEPLSMTDRFIEYPWALRQIYLYSKHDTFLDVGCAGSLFPYLIRSLEWEVHGIDIRPWWDKGIIAHKEDIKHTSFKDNQFDIITAISTIEHIGLGGRYGETEDPVGDYKAIEEIYRILRPHGIFLMTVPFGEEDKITKFHRIYSRLSLNTMLRKFAITIETVKSPEADYHLALIKAIK